jgi:hydrogenase maturation protease
MNRVLVLGVGNLILGDDGLGIHLVRLLKEKGGFPENVDFMESEEIGLSILDMASGYDTLIIIDCIQTEEDTPQGSILYVTEEKYDDLSGWGSHYIGFFEMKELAHRLGIPFPPILHILGITVDDPFRIDFELSLEIKKLLPNIQKELQVKVTELCADPSLAPFSERM